MAVAYFSSDTLTGIRTPLCRTSLTLLIGRNNAGKTSAYAPLLLLRQILGARNPETALLFRGDLVDFGTYEDVVTDHDRSRQLGMYLDFGPAAMTRYFGSQVDAIARSLEVTFAASVDHPAVLVKSSVQDESDKALVSRTLQASGGYKVVSTLLPKNNEVGRPIKEVSQLRSALQSEPPNGFLFSGVGNPPTSCLAPGQGSMEEDPGVVSGRQ